LQSSLVFVPGIQSLQQITRVARKNFVRVHNRPALLTGLIDDHTVVSRGMTLMVAERARAPIIGLRYGLPLYFARIGVIDTVVNRSVQLARR